VAEADEREDTLVLCNLCRDTTGVGEKSSMTTAIDEG
jgi:hypothetical protein